MITNLKEQFKLPRKGFLAPVDFIDGNNGFSTFKKYSNGYASLFRVFISKEEMAKSETKKSITANASYGKETDGGITLSSSVEKIKGLFDPVDLISEDEFFYDTENQKFYSKNVEISAFKILEIIEQQHLKPTRPIRGLWLRIKLIFWRLILPYILEFISNTFVALLWIVSGNRTSWNIWHRMILENRKQSQDSASLTEPVKKHPEIEKTEKIDIFGYKGNVWPIVFYCISHFIVYLILFYFGIRPKLIIEIFDNNFLTVIYVIPTLVITVSLVPKILESCIFGTSSWFRKVSHKTIRI